MKLTPDRVGLQSRDGYISRMCRNVRLAFVLNGDIDEPVGAQERLRLVGNVRATEDDQDLGACRAFSRRAISSEMLMFQT